MNKFGKKLVLLIVGLLPCTGFAASSSETWSIGLLGAIVTSSQSDLNILITRANARSTISTPQFGNAYEFGGYIQRRLTGYNLALQLRPSYYMSSTTGTGSGGTFEYALTGYTVAPLMKYYVLESPGVKLYLIGGISWGYLSGRIQEGSAQVSFAGSNIGYQGGLGTSFCFGAKNSHCLTLEGMFRYLYIERNVANTASGTFSASNPPSLSAPVQAGKEVELDSKDLGTQMSGVQGIVGYQFGF